MATHVSVSSVSPRPERVEGGVHGPSGERAAPLYRTPHLFLHGTLVRLVQGGSQGRRRDLYEGRYSIG